MDISRFMIAFSKVPLNLRDEIIIVIEKQPITWNLAYNELINKTKKGEEILKSLINLRII